VRITDIRTHVLLDPGYDVGATSSAQDTIVVEIETDEGLTGIGETDLNAWIARACIEAPGTHTMSISSSVIPASWAHASAPSSRRRVTSSL